MCFMSVFDAKRIFQQEKVKFRQNAVVKQKNRAKHTFREKVVFY